MPGRFTLGSFSATSGNSAGLTYTNAPGSIKQYNTMFGLYSFYISNDNFMDWNGTVT